MGRPEFETIPNIKMVGIMLRLTRSLRITGKEVITNIGFYVLKQILQMRKRGVYGSSLIKIDASGLGRFTEMVLTSTPV